jgi:hypothetical protein
MNFDFENPNTSPEGLRAAYALTLEMQKLLRRGDSLLRQKLTKRERDNLDKAVLALIALGFIDMGNKEEALSVTVSGIGEVIVGVALAIGAMLAIDQEWR